MKKSNIVPLCFTCNVKGFAKIPHKYMEYAKSQLIGKIAKKKKSALTFEIKEIKNTKKNTCVSDGESITIPIQSVYIENL